MNPIEAVTSSDPYPFYARLISEKPLYFDSSLKMWVASDARVVSTILTDERFRVRPQSEPIPGALADLRSGDVFGSLMRMTDGPTQCPLKKAALEAINLDCARECGRLALDIARSLNDGSEGFQSLNQVRKMMFLLPTYTMGMLLGVPQAELPQLVVEVNSFVVGISPTSTTEQKCIGNSAAESLSQRLSGLLSSKEHAGPLLRAFSSACSGHAISNPLVVSNLIGFLFQTYDATAGLIGNSLRVLAASEELSRSMKHNSEQLKPFVQEVMRYDAPVQNTRRYALGEIALEDWTLHDGDQILVVLAAANRDPSRYTNPHDFIVDRTGPPSFGFGLGHHACPGEPLALEIAVAAIRALLATPFPLEELGRPVSYRPSGNARIPLF